MDGPERCDVPAACRSHQPASVSPLVRVGMANAIAWRVCSCSNMNTCLKTETDPNGADFRRFGMPNCNFEGPTQTPTPNIKSTDTPRPHTRIQKFSPCENIARKHRRAKNNVTMRGLTQYIGHTFARTVRNAGSRDPCGVQYAEGTSRHGAGKSSKMATMSIYESHTISIRPATVS
jgi:hypothetical protein